VIILFKKGFKLHRLLSTLSSKFSWLFYGGQRWHSIRSWGINSLFCLCKKSHYSFLDSFISLTRDTWCILLRWWTLYWLLYRFVVSFQLVPLIMKLINFSLAELHHAENYLKQLFTLFVCVWTRFKELDQCTFNVSNSRWCFIFLKTLVNSAFL